MGSVSAPDPIDPGKSMGKYLFGKEFKKSKGITDPYLQGRLLEAESTYRPLYTALELSDIGVMAQGLKEDTVNPEYQSLQAEMQRLQSNIAETQEIVNPITGEVTTKGVLSGRKLRKANERLKQIEDRLAVIPETMKATPGLFDLLEEQSARAGALQREQLGLQREADVGALKEYAPQVVEAYREADPYSTGLAELASRQAETLYSEAEGQLSPERARMAEQAARQASLSRGRVMDQSAIAGELLGREQFRSGLRAEARQAGGQAFGMNRQLAGDVGMTILGRPSAAIGLGGQMLGQAQQGASGPMGPQLFDPNVGINLAMQQQSLESQADIATAANRTAMTTAAIKAAGGIAGGFAGKPPSCWVAREVYGIDNPQWMEFREWMLNDSPSWFRNLYLKYGAKFAEFISDKPLLKSAIRSWMNTKIK
jgi:hypothetical protein